MAASDIGSPFGAAGNTTANQASIALTLTGSAAVGDLAVVVIAVDNQDASDDADTGDVTGVTDNATGGSNTWTKAIAWTSANGVAQGGAHVAMFYSVLARALPATKVITATFATASTSDAQGMIARGFSLGGGTGVTLEATNHEITDAADPPSLDATTPNVECIRIRAIASEVGNNISLTPTAGWTAWENGNSATSGTTAEMCARAEHIISTATSAASNPTYVAADEASVYAAFSITGGGPSSINKIISVSMGSARSVFRGTGKIIKPTISQSITAAAARVPRQFAQIVNSAHAQAASLIRTIGHGISVAMPQSIVIRRALGKIVAAPIAQAVTAFAARPTQAYPQIASATQAQAAALLKMTGRTISAASPQAVTMRRAAGKLVAAGQSQAVTVIRAIAHRIVSIVQAQAVTLSAIGGHPKIVNAASGQAVTVRAPAGKLVAVIQASAATLRRAVVKLIPVSEPQAVTVGFVKLRRIAISASSPESVLVGRGVLRTVTATQAQAVSVPRAIGHRIVVAFPSFVAVFNGGVTTIQKAIAITQGQAAAVRRAISRKVIATTGQIVTRLSTLRSLISIQAGQAVAVSFVRFRLAAVSVSQSQTVIVQRAMIRKVSIATGQAVTAIRSAGKRLTIGLGQAVISRRTPGRLVSVITGQLVSFNPRHKVDVLISLATAQVVAFNPRHKVDVVISAAIGQSVTIVKEVSITIGTAIASVVSLATRVIVFFLGGRLVVLNGISSSPVVEMRGDDDVITDLEGRT